MLTFILNGIFGGSHSKVFLNISIPWVFLKCFSYFMIYCMNDCSLETALSGCFLVSSTLVTFKLTWKENFLESTLRGWNFSKSGIASVVY